MGLAHKSQPLGNLSHENYKFKFSLGQRVHGDLEQFSKSLSQNTKLKDG